MIATFKTIDVRRPDQFQPRSMTRTLNRSRATDGSALSETLQASMRCFGQVAHERPLRAKTGRSIAARRIRDVHDVRHRLVNRGALSLVIERESQYLTTDLSPNNRCTHESDFNSSNPALTEKTERL